MKTQKVLNSIFFLLVISTFSSSCGLIEKFRKNPEQPTDSKNSEDTASTEKSSEADDLFSDTMKELKEEPLNASGDAPSNITATESPSVQDDLKSLEEEFSGSPEAQSAPKLSETQSSQVKVEESLPEIKADLPPDFEANENINAGKVMSYKVRKGETLMQIAFKIYGDVSKWKDLKKMNGAKLSKNSELRSNMELKYTAPAKEFVWNPEGTPYLIKTGETLGIISNSVYQTPKKWKSIWENNKPLIKNPNVIYAGFTLYYKGNTMANYVQPKSLQKKSVKPIIDQTDVIKEAKIEEALKNQNITEANEIDLTKEVQSAPVREFVKEDVIEEVMSDEQEDRVINR